MKFVAGSVEFFAPQFVTGRTGSTAGLVLTQLLAYHLFAE
jgi:hypothetical protein